LVSKAFLYINILGPARLLNYHPDFILPNLEGVEENEAKKCLWDDLFHQKQHFVKILTEIYKTANYRSKRSFTLFLCYDISHLTNSSKSFRTSCRCSHSRVFISANILPSSKRSDISSSNHLDPIPALLLYIKLLFPMNKQFSIGDVFCSTRSFTLFFNAHFFSHCR